MAYDYLDIAATPSVRAAQKAMGSDRLWTGRNIDRASQRFSPQEMQYIAERDSFYIATVSETGWPYVQHRGGPPGFLRVVDERTLAFADYSGNRQYISVGNLATDRRASLILMDYPHRTRLKIYAHVEIVSPDEEPVLAQVVAVDGYKAPHRTHLHPAARCLRLELPATHHATFHRAAGQRRRAADARADRAAAAGECGVEGAACGIGVKGRIGFRGR